MAVAKEAATVPDHGEVVSYLGMDDEAPNTRYSRLLTDSELEAMEACDPGEDETVLTRVKVASYRIRLVISGFTIHFRRSDRKSVV